MIVIMGVARRLCIVCPEVKPMHRWPPLVLGSPFLLAGCGLSGPETFTETGTVERLQLEGGCWSLQTEAERYEPTNLPPEFEEDGLRVRFEAEVRTDLASICQIGPIVELHDIERLEE